MSIKVAGLTIRGLLCPFSGPYTRAGAPNGVDLDREFFAKTTDFGWALSSGLPLPLLYNHGTDSDVKLSAVGTITSLEKKDDGVWMEAQLDKASRFTAAITALIKKGALKLSGGAMQHLVRTASSGEIIAFPLVEGSLTPSASNSHAHVSLVDLPTAKSHWKSAGLQVATLDAMSSTVPLATDAEIVALRATALAHRARDLVSRRGEDGRVLSDANRAAITAAVIGCQELLAATNKSEELELLELFAAAYPPPDAITRELAALQRYARRMS